MKVPSWPSGHIKIDGDVLEFGAGDLTRVPIADLTSVDRDEKAGRLRIKLEYTAGLDKVKTSAWVETNHAAEFDELVAELQSRMG